ncbi:hypothetical protein [Haloferax sp. YSSS75]|uniref:hypothetical protein n=1 Tax=Haloferax sp. YSSS75 TaxID=3388564 RepID=UPI00398C9113
MISEYGEAKTGFLKWLQESARERGHTPTLDEHHRVLYEEPRLLLRTRASVRQNDTLRFKVNDEARYNSDDFERVYLVLLELSEKDRWNPETDHFYPLPLRFVKESAKKDVNGDYPVGFRLKDARVARARDNLDLLFEPEEYVAPGDQIDDPKVACLNDIARKFDPDECSP